MSRPLLLLALLSIPAGCASPWQPVAVHDRWTLYERPEDPIERGGYESAFERAFDAVEALLGPFEERVDVHAWDGSVPASSETVAERQQSAGGGLDPGVHEIPGIGPARIQAWHARRRAGGWLNLSPSGVFTGVADTGTAVHELVHARLGELDAALPLWFEEGMASFLGDGAAVDGRWIVDGLACWPLRELAEEALDDDDLARLLDLDATRESSVRDNVLVHFLGWALVFDLQRKEGPLEWTAWRPALDALAGPERVRHARARLNRTLDPSTPMIWLERLDDPDPARRFACAKGTWKLRSAPVLARLLESLEREANDEVAVALAINALAASGELELSRDALADVRRRALPVLVDARLPSAQERDAAFALHVAWRDGDASAVSRAAFDALARFWEE